MSIHSSYYMPNIYPIKGDTVKASISRAQAIDPTVTLNREKVEEIGRDGVVGYLKKTPTVGYRLTQLEYGDIEFWQKLINDDDKGEGSASDEITLADFKTPYFDICAYLTDDDETFTGTAWYPELRCSGFSITIGEPDGSIERSFDLVGEKFKILQGANKYFICNKETAIADTDWEIDLSARAPAVNPDWASGAGEYMFRVVRYRDPDTLELSEGVTSGKYAYSNATKKLTVYGTLTGDVVKAYYSSATAPIAPDSLFTENDEISGLLGDSASIYLYIPGSGLPTSSNYIYRLQSASIEVSFDREDIKEIGNVNVVARGVRDKTVTVSLGRILEDFTVEEVLRGVSADYGLLDITKFSDEITLIVKIFTDNTKDTLAYGFKATGLSPTEIRGGASVNEYVNKEASLEGESLIISSDTDILGI